MVKLYKISVITLIFIALFNVALVSIYAAQNVSSCRSFDQIDKGESFVLTQDLTTSSATCLEINEVDISIDCAGHSVNAAFNGIEINSESNINITNCKVLSQRAISAIVDNSYFYNNTFTSTQKSEFRDSDNNNFICNSFSGGDVGFDLVTSNYNNFTCLNINSTQLGVNISQSSNNRFVGNISNTTTTAIELADNDVLIVNNYFEFQLEKGTQIAQNLAEFEEHFDSNENNISNTYRALYSTFNFFDAINSTLDNVTINLTTSEKSFNINEVLNSGDSQLLFRSYFGYNLLSTNDFDEKNISNYSITVSKTNYSSIVQNVSYQEEYNFSFFSTQGLNITIVQLNSTQFNNESQELQFRVVDLNNYTIESVNVTLDLDPVNYTLNSGIYSIILNGSEISLGSHTIGITAINQYNINSTKNATFTIVSSNIPQINAQLSKNTTFVNENVSLNVSISSLSNYTYTITTSLNETLNNVSFQNYSSSNSGEVIFTISVIDSNSLTNSLNISLNVYNDTPITFNTTSTNPLSKNGSGKIELVNITDVNNVSKWYEFYIDSALVQNSTDTIFKFNPYNYSASFYTQYDNVTNTTKTYLDIEIQAKSSIGTFGNQTITLELVNSSNVSYGITMPTSITTSQSASVTISYSSSLNYTFKDVEVMNLNVSLGTFTTQSFSLSGFSQGVQELSFYVCNQFYECETIYKNLTVNQASSGSSSGGGGGGGSSSRSNSRSTTPLGGDGFEFELVDNSNDEPTQIVSTPFFEEVEEEQIAIYEVENAQLDINEGDINQIQSGQLTQGIGSWLAIVIGFIIISLIVYFALIRRS